MHPGRVNVTLDDLWHNGMVEFDVELKQVRVSTVIDDESTTSQLRLGTKISMGEVILKVELAIDDPF